MNYIIYCKQAFKGGVIFMFMVRKEDCKGSCMVQYVLHMILAHVCYKSHVIWRTGKPHQLTS